MPRFTRTPSPLSIVLAGIVTGAVGWIPVAWFLAPDHAVQRVPSASMPKTEGTLVLPAPVAAVEPITHRDSPILPRALAGGGLPIERADLPAATAGGSEPSVPQLIQPASFENAPVASGAADGRRSNAVALDTVAEPELKSVETAAQMRVGEEGQLRPIVQPESGHVSIREPSAARPLDDKIPTGEHRLSVDETDTLRLMNDLHSDDAAIRDAATKELSQRSFSEVHLELARQLTSEKAEVRAAVASQLPATPGIDARVWLTWLMRDEDADVRLAAIGVLATTGPSDTLRRAMEIARQDRDPRIRKLLEQYEKQRKSGR